MGGREEGWKKRASREKQHDEASQESALVGTSGENLFVVMSISPPSCTSDRWGHRLLTKGRESLENNGVCLMPQRWWGWEGERKRRESGRV